MAGQRQDTLMYVIQYSKIGINRTGVTVEQYRQCEEGTQDLNIAFLYRCALAFGVVALFARPLLGLFIDADAAPEVAVVAVQITGMSTCYLHGPSWP